MTKSSPFLGVGLSLTSLLLSTAELAVAPTPGAVAGTLDSSRQLWDDIRRLCGKDKETRELARRIAESLNRKLATVSSKADKQEIRGAATAAEALLREVSKDDAAVVEAVRHPERLETFLRSRAKSDRDLIAESAESFFDALLPAVAEEFARLAPSSPRFEIGALTRLLDGLEGVQEGIVDLKGGQAKILDVIDRLREDPGRIPISSPPTQPPDRIRFGSRPARAPHFVTRSEQEAARRSVIEEAGPPTALTGMRGRGKSQVAAAIADRCEAAGWPLVAWITADSREAVMSAFSELGLLLGVSTEGDRSPEVLATRCLTLLRSVEAADRLIVLDNVESFEDLRSLVPTGPGLRVLATTTRAQVPGSWRAIPVGVFDRAQSVARLLKDNEGGDEEQSNAIADALGDLPVAVAQAAATIRDNRYTFEGYLRDLREYPISEVVTRVEGEDYPEAVGSALRLAYRSALKRITAKDSEQGGIAEAQVGALSLLAASGVPEHWLTAMDDGSPKARRALTALVDASVCERSEDGTRVLLHRLQAQVIREDWPSDSEEGLRAADAAVALLDSVSSSTPEKFEGRRREAVDLAVHLRAVADQDYSRCLLGALDVVAALARTIRNASELGAPQTALTLADAVEEVGHQLGPDHPDTLSSRHNLAGAYQAAGRLDQAIDLYEQNLTDTLRILGPNHPHTAVFRANLAAAYRAAGREEEALERSPSDPPPPPDTGPGPEADPPSSPTDDP